MNTLHSFIHSFYHVPGISKFMILQGPRFKGVGSRLRQIWVLRMLLPYWFPYFPFYASAAFPVKWVLRLRTPWAYTLSPLAQGWAHVGCGMNGNWSLCSPRCYVQLLACMSASSSRQTPWGRHAGLGTRRCSGRTTKKRMGFTCSKGLAGLQVRNVDRSST